MDTYKKNVSWKHAIEQNYCETLEWNRVCNDFIMRLYNEKDRSIIKMSINEVLSVLIIKCSNDNLSFRSAAEETIGKIFHFCVKYKLINYLSSITLIQIKEKELLPRSLKVCLVLLSNCVDSIKCTSVQNFVDNVFCNIIQKFDNMIHSICIESFVEFFKAFLTNLGFLLEQSYTEECLEIFILNLLNETVLVRHSITQCIHYLIQHCPNQQEKLAKKIVDRILVTFTTSMNDSKIIGMAELLKETSFIITQFEEYHSKLIEIIILGIKCCDKNVGVINAYIEMNIALFKTNNNLFHNSLSSYHLDSQNIPLSNFIISNLCSKFLYNTVDGTIRENVKISMQCNILEFVGVCCNISNQYILNNTLLIQTIIKLSDHSDFIVREKIVIILTELIHNNDDNIQNLQFCSILASQFDDSAFTVVSTLICQLGKYFNKVLQLYNKPHLNLNNMSFVVITMNKIMSYLDGHHWSVVCRICDFIVTMDFVEMRKHFDYITTKYYQDSFYSKLIKLVSSSDARIQKKAVTCLVKILRNMSTENNIYFCKTDFENFITDRYLNGQTIAIKHNFENLRQKSYILCELINLLATVNNQNLTGVISCIALCITINKTQMVKLFQLFKSSIEMFILLSNLYSVDELISFDKKVDLFNCCHKLYRYASIDCLQLLIQMIKSVDSSCSQILYKIINHAADTFEDPLFIQPPPYFLNLESTVINMNNEDRINFDKSIIVFLQEIVDIALQSSVSIVTDFY
uniref:CSON007166 protein n=1 Tax=Culicoides sonorensis TaxID=179676 RepID=A0A336LNY0_CULSO